MSMEEWENFVYSACLIDWKKFAKKYEKITKLFHKGKEVHLIGRS
jgi:leucyl aminopeptidase (aminopeptidase T)